MLITSLAAALRPAHGGVACGVSLHAVITRTVLWAVLVTGILFCPGCLCPPRRLQARVGEADLALALTLEVALPTAPRPSARKGGNASSPPTLLPSQHAAASLS